MTGDEMKRLVRRFYERAVAGDLGCLEEILASDYVDHNVTTSVKGPGVARERILGVRGAFPDLMLQVTDQIAEGDRVVSVVVARGTHTGEWRGIPPTGRTIDMKGINIDRIAGGRIVEHWGHADLLGILVQLGVDPLGERG